MIYDGECNFCKFWIVRWQTATRGRVDFIASQDPRVGRDFPELTSEQLDTSVQFIETDGLVFTGAEAVFHSLTYSHCWAWFLWVYQNVPAVKPVSEWAYHFVSVRRPMFSFLTRMFWGREAAIPTYNLVRSVFLRLLGVIYLSAFFSLGTQVIGLIGSDGILPAKHYMALAQTHFDQNGIGVERYAMLPTLCWFNSSDHFLHFLCGAGCVISLLLIFNVAPALCLFLLWLIYLSLSAVGHVFLSFQWDVLLLETGFLAIFFAPLQLFPRFATEPQPSRIFLWLPRWLLFRLMFESGLVKLLSGDTVWRNLSALHYHYETQPLPTWIGWYAHQLPDGFQKTCVFLMFVIELAVPFLIFFPRRLRFFACALLILLQICILLTGNYCFFNLLTIALCLLLLDDAAMTKWIPKAWRGRFLPAQMREISSKDDHSTDEPILPEITIPSAPLVPKPRIWTGWIIGPIAVIYLIVTLTQLVSMGSLGNYLPRALVWLDEEVAPFRSMNGYGLFAMMTTSRPEITIEGSNDGKTWLSYEFKYKPGDLKRAPGFVAPHQPRLDWQMWFAALGDYRQNPWLVNFCVRLLQGSPEVLKLLANNPFPRTPPKFVRARVYDYHFSNFDQRREDGVWWTREYKGEYLPAFSLEDVK